jgi:hypothetical protein
VTLKNGAPQKTQAGAAHTHSRARDKKQTRLAQSATLSLVLKMRPSFCICYVRAAAAKIAAADLRAIRINIRFSAAVCAAGLRLNCADANAFFCLAYTKCNYCAVPWLALSQFIAPVCFFHSGAAAAAAVGFDFIVHLGRVLT